MKKLFNVYSQRSRKNRAIIFRDKLAPGEGNSILDLGGGNGKHIHMILPKDRNFDVTISDIRIEDLNYAKSTYGYRAVSLPENSKLPFDDNSFDIVFCNSVIEHVTIPKKNIWTEKNTKRFQKSSLERQQEFADEIKRVGKSYFVQTPYKYFFIESHSWLPGIIVFAPRYIQIKIIRFFNSFWPKKTTPDWNLLTFAQMRKLFPEATIYKEKSFGLTKSLIAVKK